jgi:hypothetical protein
MQAMSARRILQTLAQGIHPLTGDELPGGTALQEVEVLQALNAGVAALEQAAARAYRRARLPANSGCSWSMAEEDALFAAFRAGDALEVIATRHARTVRAIEDRLEMHGLLTPASRTTKSPSRLSSIGHASTQ